ncbi:Short-chain alcohol dehydrogenase [Gaiella occulta]|uniref:Short-chain alcohol dehydrogenase n=1 Tax=Gaiella occulta TaxID=1002870 RepID=A0A7M2Z1A7_9ACTN|nr:SDR family NAD(P)-dependent oxidoreductase [Gaiella occulta]RDI76071.1 Short-chain alcohol dehydrogenase [Gaiella occulta]
MIPRGLRDGTAIVTGGATLIGQVVVRAFHEAGASAVVADIDAAGGDSLARELGARVFFSATDIRDDGQIERCVADTVERFGGVDVLVNLACSYVDEGAASGRQDWLELLDVNVVGTAMMTKAVRPHMAAKRRGAIVNLTSISAKVAQAGRWLYPVSKAALVQLTRNMAMDLASDGTPRQLGLTGVDVVQGDGRDLGRRPRQDRPRRRTLPSPRPRRRPRGSGSRRPLPLQ